MPKRKKKTANCAATVTIHRAGEMTAAGRRDIALWLRRTANLLTSKGDKLGARFTARYMYR